LRCNLYRVASGWLEIIASIISGAFCFSWAVTVLAGRLGLIQKDGQK
jgi:hypothetical protein